MNIRPDLGLIARVSDDLRAILGDDLDEAFFDTLDGETDAVEIAARLLAGALSADALVDAIVGEQRDLADRKKRIEARGSAYRGQLLAVIDAMGVKKLELPRGTISRRNGLQSLHIADETAIPSQLCKTTIAPDKAAIKAQLLAGENVPGAELLTGADGVTIRVK